MSLRIAYVLLEWPRYSETFILNEMLAMTTHGQPAQIFCLRKGTATDVPPEFSGRVEWLSDASRDVTLSSNELFTLFNSRGQRFAAELGQALSRYQSRESIAGEEKRREPLFALACAIRLLFRCRRLQIKHLHCHYATLPTTVAEIAHKLGGPPYSFTGHAKDIFTMEPVRLAKKVAGAKFVISCSEAGCETLRSAAPEHTSHIYCVHHGIRNQEWQIDRDPRREPFRIVAVGRLTAKKGFSTLVTALARLRQRGINASVEIIGEGREREALLAVARELAVADYLQMPGKLSQDAIRAAFSRAAAFVMPSIILKSNNQDGIANAVLEAMAAGVPVVVADIPALREVVTDGETGLIFPSGDVAALAEKLELIAEDSNLNVRLGAAARKRVAQLDCSVAAEQLSHLFARYVTK